MAMMAAPARAQRALPGDRPTTALTGVVVDSLGRGVAGAYLVVRDTSRRAGQLRSRWESTSDSAGSFRIDGIIPGTLRLEVLREAFEPAGFDFQIVAGVTAQLRIRLVSDELWTLAKRAVDSLARGDSIARSQRAPLGAFRTLGLLSGVANTLSGRIATAQGEPVARVQVQALGTAIFTLSDSVGRFALRDLPAGPYVLRARKVGFEPVVFQAILMAVDTLDASVTLTPLSLTAGRSLDTVRVNADFDRLSRRLRGFDERRRSQRGLYIDRAEVAMRRPTVVSDLLRGRANVLVQRNGPDDIQILGPRLSISSGYCPLALILDGVLIPSSQGRIDNLIPVDMVAGIEVYTSGTSVPSEFQRPDTDCGAVVIWTR